MTDGTDPILAVSSQSLLVVSGQAKGTVIPIRLGELLLGREAGQAGRLGGDPMLSRRHARITIDGHGQVVLEDLGSTNGTFLNGARVTSRQPIRASDIIEVGGSKLQVLEATPARTSPRIPAADVTRPGRIPDEAPSGEWEGLGADTDTAPPDQVASAPPPRPPPPPRPAPARPAPEPRRGRATVQGQVRGIQQRNCGEQGSGVAWAFRIERYDQDGNRLQPIPAQMRGIAFEGSFSDGDEVIATGVWKRSWWPGSSPLESTRTRCPSVGPTRRTSSTASRCSSRAAPLLTVEQRVSPIRRRVPWHPLQAPRCRPWPSPNEYRLGSLLAAPHGHGYL